MAKREKKRRNTLPWYISQEYFATQNRTLHVKYLTRDNILGVPSQKRGKGDWRDLHFGSHPSSHPLTRRERQYPFYVAVYKLWYSPLLYAHPGEGLPSSERGIAERITG